jgi:DNA-binding transcriptional LysR family regulator
MEAAVELRQLAYFAAVAEESSFTRAAQRLRVAQPAVSQQIQRLERELGEALFRRDNRSVALTSAGQTLLPHAHAALASAQRAKDAVAALGELLSGRLAIGLVQAQPDSSIAALLGEFHQRHPKVQLALLENDPPQLFEDVEAGRLDVAFVGLVGKPPDGLDVQLYSVEPLVVAVGLSHPLAHRASVSMEDLATMGLACLVEGTGLRSVLEQQSAQAGFVAQVIAETTALVLLADLVAMGVGAALIPSSVVAGRQDLVRIPLTTSVERRIGLVWPRATPLSPAGRAFLELARSR